MPSGDQIAATIIAMAKSYLGQPYVSGGTAPGGFDCSGLVQYVYGQNGVSLPRLTWDQVNAGMFMDEQHAAPGDLVLFDETGADAPGPGGSPWGHVGIYLGGGMFLGAQNPSSGVTIAPVQGFSPVGRVMFRRVIPNYAGTGDTGVTTPGVSSALMAMGGGAAMGPNWDDSSIAASLGLSKSLFDSDPELKRILAQADSGGWDPSTAVGQARFTAAIQNTKWYKSHTEQQRKWETLNKSDPATARQQFVSSLGLVMHTAATMGIKLSKDQEWVLASQNAQFAWTDDELKYGIAAHFQTNKSGVYGGDAGKIADDIYTQAAAYGMPMSASAVGHTVFQVLNGQATQEDYLNNMKTYAAGQFPAIKDQIMAGRTVRDIAEPYLNTYTNTLELSPDQVNLATDKNLRKALSYTPPPTKTADPGKPTSTVKQAPPELMPIWQFESQLKDDPRWLQTDNAQKSLVDTSTNVLKQFGLTA